MPELVYSATNFKGVANSYGATAGFPIACDNFDFISDNNATSIYHGFLTKFPKSEAAGDDIGSQVSRGIFLFVPSTYASDGDIAYIQAFSDGTVRYLTGGAWTSLNTGFTNLHFDFDAFNYFDLLLWCNGKEGLYKWKYGWATGIPVQDKEGTATNLTGTLTFTEDSPVVTAAGGAFATELFVGSFIRRATGNTWYEVESITDDNNLELTTLFLESTGAGGAGTSQKAANCSAKGRFLSVWKDRVIVGSGDNS